MDSLISLQGLIAKGVQLRCDEPTYSALTRNVNPANISKSVPEDYDTEFLDLTMAVRAVESVEEAIEHINTHGSHHTDAIITENKKKAELFMANVDAAGIYWNASTRFADGFRYGFGAEVGVSTNKTHARGPVGLDGLTIYKYVLYGNGQCVGMFGEGKRQYLHKALPL